MPVQSIVSSANRILIDTRFQVSKTIVRHIMVFCKMHSIMPFNLQYIGIKSCLDLRNMQMEAELFLRNVGTNPLYCKV